MGTYLATKLIEFERIVHKFPDDLADADIQKALSATAPNGLHPLHAQRDFLATESSERFHLENRGSENLPGSLASCFCRPFLDTRLFSS